jgi:GntR family transcriptional regulator
VDESRPIFLQIAEQIENDIIAATAGKGVNLLVDEGILYKKRGIGMFVADGSRARLVAARRETFTTQYVRPLVEEAAKLGISPDQLADLIRKEEAK